MTTPAVYHQSRPHRKYSFIVNKPRVWQFAGPTQGQDSPLPYFSAINPMSQNPLKLDQQVPRHIWGYHGRGFWMQSSPNLQSSGPKLALLSWKVKIETKSLTKSKNRPHASPCRKNCQHMPTLILRAMIRDWLSYLQMLKTCVALDGDLIPGPFCAYLGLQIVLARISATIFCQATVM